MPCYVEPPSKSFDFCLEDMLNKALELLSAERKEEIKRHYTNAFKDRHTVPHVKEQMCLICKYLSFDELNKIENHDGYVGLLEAYLNHLMDDFANNDDEKEKLAVQKEALRLNHIIKYTRNGKTVTLYHKDSKQREEKF